MATHKIVVEIEYERGGPPLTADEMADEIHQFLRTREGLHDDIWFPGVRVVRTVVLE